jgi:hypothetical protein
MMVERHMIEPGDPDSPTPYGHLVPVVEALLRAGNRLADSDAVKQQQLLGLPAGSGFYATQGGWTCSLAEPIDFELLRRSFDFPESIHFNVERDVIACDRTWIEISGNWDAKGPLGEELQ